LLKKFLSSINLRKILYLKQYPRVLFCLKCSSIEIEIELKYHKITKEPGHAQPGSENPATQEMQN
jgi:hypothetical protein